MFRSYSKNLTARKLTSILVSVFLYVLMLPVVSSVPRLTHAAVGLKAQVQQDQQPQIPNIPVIPPGSAYRQTNFVSDSPGVAFVLDPLLVNPWGISKTASSPLWVSNNGTSTSGLYRGDVGGSPFVNQPGMPFVTIPGGLPTGTVANTTGSTTDFTLPGACAAPPCTARFLFSSITGNISGWNPNAPAAGWITPVLAASNPGS